MKTPLLAMVLTLNLISPAWAGLGAPIQAKMVAEQGPPQPPDQNPHPPSSIEDQRRVDFAVAEIKANYGPGIEIRHPHVIRWSFQNFQKNRNLAAEPPPKIAAARSVAMLPMQAPQLKPDEYMVHVYAKFASDPRWHHLDVIMSEDASGQLSRRGFFSIPIPDSSHKLPHGVVC